MRTQYDIAHEGTLGAEGRTRMTFDQDATAHLMAILTDLYSDPALAVIREYSTNARDAHVAAGNPDPIEVELPTAIRPIFIVRDRGTGMTVDTIVNNFSKYGWSSKRDTDEQVGMLGIGCKAGLTYTSQFTLTSVCGGVEAVVLITREEDGGAALQVIDTRSTDAPNGVEVQVPVRDVYDFTWKAEKFFRYWESGTVNINGNPPSDQYPHADDLVLDPDVILTSHASRDYVVMGNVPYEVPSAVDNLIEHGQWHAIIRVAVGDVNFTPSREALHLTRRTLDVLDTARDYIKHALGRRAQVDVDSAETPRAALEIANRWRFMNYLHLTYRGAPVPADFPVDGRTTWRYNTKYVGNSAGTLRRQHLKVDDVLADDVLIVTNAPRTISSSLKEKLCKWAGGYDTPRDVILVHDHIDLGWLDGVETVPYEDIRAVRLSEKEKRPSTAGKYRVATRGGPIEWRTDLSGPIIYVEKGDMDNRGASALANYFDGKVVVLNASNAKRFHREYPDALHARDYYKAQIDAFTASLSADQFAALHAGVAGMWHEIDPSKLLDPDLASLIRSVSVAEELKKTYNKLRNAASWLGIDRSEVDTDGFENRCAAMLARYPMLSNIQFSVRSYRAEQTRKWHAPYIEYANAIYIVREQLHLIPAC